MKNKKHYDFSLWITT